MSYRIAPGHQTHTPFGKALREYNGNEGYKHTVRGINPTSIYDTKFEGYRRKPTLASTITVVILIIVAIILIGYIIHCMKKGVPQDPEYFDRITVYGGSRCPDCGEEPCICYKKETDVFSEVKEEKSDVVAGSTTDYIKGGADDDYDPII